VFAPDERLVRHMTPPVAKARQDNLHCADKCKGILRVLGGLGRNDVAPRLMSARES